MNVYILKCYSAFKCLGGKCEATCCSGWSIKVDEKDYQRFCAMKDGKLKDDILGNIRQKRGEYYFANKENGDCAMLDSDGLCRIQRNTDEKHLCNTCRKYPRLFSNCDEEMYISMAASCPVISEYLLNKPVSFIIKNEEGDRFICFEDIKNCKDYWVDFNEYEENIMSVFDKGTRNLLFENSMIKLFGKLAKYFQRRVYDDIVDIFYDYIENQDEQYNQDTLDTFFLLTNERWNFIKSNYYKYRVFGLVNVDNDKSDNIYKRVFGELLLMRIFLFLLYVKQNEITEELYRKSIHLTYRLCAHGNKMQKIISEIFEDFYREEILWNYVNM